MNNSNSRSSRRNSKQQKRQSAIGFFESLLRGLLCIIIVVSIALTFVSAIVKYRVYNTSGIVNAILTPEYYSLVYDQVEEAIEDSCLQLDYDKDKAMALVDESQVNYMANKYISSMVNKLLVGSSEELPVYPPDAFEKAFNELFDQHEAETGETIDQETRDYYVDMFVRSVEYAIYLTGDAKLDDEISSIHQKLSPLLNAFSEFGLFLLFTIAMLVVYFFSFKRSTLTKIYRLVSVIWIGTSIIFIPAILVFIYDLPARIPLLDSPIKSIIVSMIEYFVNFMLLITSSVWAVATIMLIVCIIKLVKRPYKHLHDRRRDYDEEEEYDDYPELMRMMDSDADGEL